MTQEFDDEEILKIIGEKAKGAIDEIDGLLNSLNNLETDYKDGEKTPDKETEGASNETQGILDSRTRDIIFGRRRRGWDFSLSSLNLELSPAASKSLDQLVQTPLNDLEKINGRLDTIGELVSDRKSRNRVSKISKVLAADYGPFYEQIGTFLERGSPDIFSTYFRNHEAQRLTSMIGQIAKYNLPASFGREQYSAKTLNKLAGEYQGFIQSGDGRAILRFFGYVKRLDRKIRKIEEELRAQETSQDSRKEQSGISYEQLRGLIDVEKLTQAKEALEIAKIFSEELFPYSQLANMAIKNNYIKPKVVAREENCLIIKNGKWDKLYDEKDVVPNNTYLDKDMRVEVLEGVNAGGKTVDMKKALYIASLALAGSWVPAEYAKVSIRDKIMLREKGTGDAISAFQRDCRNVNEASPPKGEYWLIGMDETFTSTERKGGEALTYGLIQSVLDQGSSLLITSSHYLGLSESFVKDPRVRFNHFPFERQPSERRQGEIEIMFPYKKQKGPLQDFKYAIAVSSTLGFDKQILAFAEQRLAQRGI